MLIALVATLVCRPASAAALPPPVTAASSLDIPEAELLAAKEIARKEAPEVAGLVGPADPGGPAELGPSGVSSHARVLAVEMLVPFIFHVALTGNIDLQLLVVDGHVVRGRSMKAVSHYLARLHILEHPEAMNAARLAGILNQWGELPIGFESVDAVTAGITEKDKPSLVVSPREARLIVYDRYQKVPQMPAPGQNQLITLGRPSVLRATLRIDSKYNLKWTVEVAEIAHPNAWKPFKLDPPPKAPTKPASADPN